MDFMGPWAGHRLVCLGEGPIEDYPPCMLSERQHQELAAGLNKDEVGDGESPKRHAGGPAELHEIVSCRYKETNDDIPPARVISISSDLASYETRNMPKSIKSRVFDVIRKDYFSRHYPDSRKWVLPNLTTHE